MKPGTILTNQAIDVEAIASEIHGLWRSGTQIDLLTSRIPDLGVNDAYQVASSLRKLREADGERVVGRKLAFTNRGLWSRYNVAAPGWGYVYDRTCFEFTTGIQDYSIAGVQEPRIEPEIILGFSQAPTPGMTEEELWRCVGWISHGFEIVHSIFPAWRFTGPDTIVGYALHAALFIGPKVKVDETSNLPMRLRTFTVDLSRDGVLIETGGGANVLGSPLSAAKDFNDTLGTDAARPTLSAGEFVSTGTLTDAMPVRPNEIWETQLHGLPLAGVRLAIRQ